MTLLRAVARTMLAGYFVADGAKTLRNPHELVPVTQPIADAVVPAAKKVAPAALADKIPTDTVTLVRINGALQVLGGIGLATGKFRRVGAILLAASIIPQTLARHAFWSADDADARSEQREQFVKNVALAGGVLLAAQDTEGKPSLAWRAQAGTERGARKVKRQTERGAKAIRREAARAAKDARHLASSAAKEAEIKVKDVQLGLH